MAYLIHQLLERSARVHGDRVAIIDRKRSATYAELAARAGRIAAALRERGVAVGTPVALVMDKSLDAICAVYGVLQAGGAYVPIDPFSPPSRAARIIANCSIAHVITTPRLLDNLVVPMIAEGDACATLAHVVVPGEASGESPKGFSDAQHQGCAGRTLSAVPYDGETIDSDPGVARPTEMDLAYILHTSGSTGTPKGVAITHRNALTFVDMCAEFFAVTADDRLVGHAPLHFDLSVFDLFVAAAAGAAVVLAPPYLSTFPKKLAGLIDQHGITIWNSVASALTLMNDRGKLEALSLDSLRAIMFSGEVLPVRVLRSLRGRMKQAVFYNAYGQTEANSSTYYRVEQVPESDAARLPIGKPFPNFEVFALDSAGQTIEQAGQEGELYIRAASVAAGYYGDPERTAEKFIADPRDPVTGGRVYRTGDLVTLDADGNYVFSGRTDNLIKSRGYRIELGEIELALLACDGVERAAAVAIPDEAIGNKLCAFVSPRPGVELGRDQVLAACGAALPAYMIPEHLEIRDALPHTSTGKVDRKALRAELLAVAG